MLKQPSSYYLSLLRKLKRAADTRPHFVQELRFLLSLPLVESPPPCRPSWQKNTQADTAETTAVNESTDAASPDSSTRATVGETEAALSRYLQRPASEMLAVDSATIFAACKHDLRLVFGNDSPTRLATATGVCDGGSARTQTADLAKMVTALRDARWLEGYLDKILHKDTAEALLEMITVSEGSLDDPLRDFIPDSFFAGSVGDCPGDTGAVSTQAGKPASSQEEVRTSAAADHRVRANQSSHEATAPDSQTHQSSSDPSNVVYSAGAQGMQREMLAACCTSDFTLAEMFLRSTDSLEKAKLQKLTQNHHKELVSYVAEHLPRAVHARNEDVALLAALQDFSPEDSQMMRGLPIAWKHGYSYLLALELSPLNRGQRVQLVNTFFTSYTPELMQETSTVAVMPADAVKRLLQERDWSQDERRRLREEMQGMARNTGKAGEVTEPVQSSAVRGKTQANSTTTEEDSANTYKFQLYFEHPTKSPTALKGLLYYKVGSGEELLHEPIKVIAFPPILMMPQSL